MSIFEQTGGFLIGMVESAGQGAILFWRALGQIVFAGREFRKIWRQAFLTGVCAIPVATITAMFSGMVIAGQTGFELRAIAPGLEENVGAIVGAAMCREMGPVLTAVVLAGFVGGGMASVIGTMRVNEEIDALEVMSINPVRYLVMPRLVAMMVVVPTLVIYADVVGIGGGAVVAKYQLGVPYDTFFDIAFRQLRVKDVLFGLVKGFIFGIIITMVACQQGMTTSGGAEGVGRSTMRAVVYSFLMILVANYLTFSLLYRIFFGD